MRSQEGCRHLADDAPMPVEPHRNDPAPGPEGQLQADAVAAERVVQLDRQVGRRQAAAMGRVVVTIEDLFTVEKVVQLPPPGATAAAADVPSDDARATSPARWPLAAGTGHRSG